MAALPDEIRLLLDTVSERCAIPTGDARLVGQHSNTVIALPAARLVVRIAGNPKAFDRVTQSVAITRWLASRRFPCTEPADADPFRIDAHVLSIWRLLEVCAGPPGTGADLGRILRALHDQPVPPFKLQPMTDPLGSVAEAAQRHPNAMSNRDRSWLLTRINEIRTAWTQLAGTLPSGLIHGDAHTNNLIRVRDGEVVLGDWDHVAHGPREWDLIQPHYMRRRFNRHTEQDLDAFTAAYGRNVRTCPGFDVLVHVRELSGLSPYIRKAPSTDWARREVAHRLATLRNDDTAAKWNSPPRPTSAEQG
ncbi:phosphotransferase family protein [Actinomadura bangladeshensis]|uniref:Aminoglycoside phosphotransferase family protein n=1 Tax=Actinomadura bangladeshensis TaxID=453573 RepID=A0A4R4NM56_9ACTN|nr:aminoglycoside phosphotransferase family protein [Actinomadura bangladeshensis]TDC10279.1 aminoglycoside phosphotransferase family protein [Actinomadura bangladeshensis]